MNGEEIRISIEAYLRGELSDAAYAEVEGKIKVDPTYKSIYEELTSLVEHLEVYEVQNLKSRFAELESNIEKNKKPTKKSISLWVCLTCLILLILVAIIYYGFNPNKESQDPTANAIYAEVLEPYPNLVYSIERGGDNSNINSAVKVAMDLYDKGNFEKANLNLENLSDQSIYKDTLQLYHGISLLFDGRIETSKQLLISFNSSNLNLKRASLWYLGLCHLRLKEFDQAKPLFLALSKENGFQKSKASEIYSQLVDLEL